MIIENTEKPCRHEYVKIFQRKYKDYERRLLSTRGYLPTGFSNKDFAFLNTGAYCFCTKCRKRLFPIRTETSKTSEAPLAAQSIDIETTKTIDNWTEDNLTPNTVQPQEIGAEVEVEVEELQVEPTDVSDIVDKEITANQEENIEEENGEN